MIFMWGFDVGCQAIQCVHNLLSRVDPGSELTKLGLGRRAKWRRFSDIVPGRNRRQTQDAKKNARTHQIRTAVHSQALPEDFVRRK